MRALKSLATLCVVLLFTVAAGAAEAASPLKLRLKGGRVAEAPPPSELVINFGDETWVGYGRDCSLGLPAGGSFTGPDASYNDFGKDADGCVVPIGGSYGAHKTYGKPGGSTYELVDGATAFTINLWDNARFVTNLPTDTGNSGNQNQFKNTMTRTYTTAGALELGDEVYLRTGTEISWSDTTWNIAGPSGGYKGLYSSLTGGSGYTDGTYNDQAVSYVSGSGGSGMLVGVVVSGGAVVQVYIRDWGDGLYQPGDVLTVTGGSIGAGSGFQFTLSANINDDGWIFIRSETADTTTTIDGNLRYGGDARIEGIEITGGGFLPWMFENIDFTYLDATAPTGLSAFIVYRYSSTPFGAWGVSGRYNYVSAPNMADSWSLDGIVNRIGTWEYNHISLVDNAFLVDGRTADMTIQTNTRLENNVVHDMWIDCMKTRNGMDFDVHRNLCFHWRIAGSTHGDSWQTQGPSSGTTNPDFARVTKNIWFRGEDYGTGTGEPQGVITSGVSNSATRHGDGYYANNFFWGAAQAAMSLSYYLNPVAEFNTVTSTDDLPNFLEAEVLDAMLRFQYGDGGTMTRNIANIFAYDLQSGYTHDSTTNVTVAANTVALAAIATDPSYGPYTTRAQFLAAKTPPSTGPHMLGDGTVAGVLFPACTAQGQTTGAWNDGTVWNCSDAEWLAAHPSANLILFGAAGYRRRRRAANDNGEEVRRVA